MRSEHVICLLIAGLVSTTTQAQANQTRLPALPGAEGFGVYTPGGLRGKVFGVTTLADSSPKKEPFIAGRFRPAVQAEGPRIVLFALLGNMDLKVPLTIVNPYLTIAWPNVAGLSLPALQRGECPAHRSRHHPPPSPVLTHASVAA